MSLNKGMLISESLERGLDFKCHSNMHHALEREVTTTKYLWLRKIVWIG